MRFFVPKWGISKWAYFSIATFLVIYFQSTGTWKDKGIFRDDVAGYYWILPAVFVHHDISAEFADTVPVFEKSISRYYGFTTSNGKTISKYYIGTTLCYLPFFLVQYSSDLILEKPIHEFSEDYGFWISLSGLLFTLWGISTTRKILLFYFNEWTTAFTLLILTLGTNLLFYSTIQSAMSHAYSFSFIANFILLCLKWNRTESISYLPKIAFSYGMICLVRPVNALIILFPILLDIYHSSLWKTRIGKVWNSKLILFWSIFIFIAIIFVQLLYWKMASGSWIQFPYNGEGFFFRNPHVLEGLFSYRKGWLVYSPLMFLSLVGLIPLYRNKAIFYAVSFSFAIHLFITFSWWSWWYGGGFGARTMVDFYGLMALPLACGIEKCLKLTGRIKIILLVPVIFGIHLNLVQTRQCKIGIINWLGMTKSAYWNVFLKGEKPKNQDALLKMPNDAKALKGEDEYDFSPFQ